MSKFSPPTPLLTDVVQELINRGRDARSVTWFIDDKHILRASWRFPPSARHTREEIVVTYGNPNYAEREALKRAKRQDTVLHTLVRPYPKKKKK